MIAADLRVASDGEARKPPRGVAPFSRLSPSRRPPIAKRLAPASLVRRLAALDRAAVRRINAGGAHDETLRRDWAQ